MVRHQRHVGPGLRDDITIRKYSSESAECDIELIVDADLADLFDVKGGRVAAEAIVREDALTFRVDIPPRGHWSTSVIVVPLINGKGPDEPFTETTPPHHRTGVQRHIAWGEHVPRVTVSDRSVQNVLNRSQSDPGSLRIFDSEHSERVAVAAGAPWFMALFGRDSLLSSYMALLVDPNLAAGTLQTLAEIQGTKVDPASEEEPGRIPHEVRFGLTSGLALGGTAYYGTADATPLFVSVLSEPSRRGLGGDIIESLLPHADRALEWIEHFGDRDGDGFVEYLRPNPHGLLNQGWKDSWDGIYFADGRMAEPPIALCEVQGYVYAACIGRSLLARSARDTALERQWAERAASLKASFNERF